MKAKVNEGNHMIKQS